MWEELNGSSRRIDLVMGLIERLKFEPWSQYRADIAGDERFMGWTPEASVLAANYNVAAAGNKGKKLSKSELYPVPQVKKKTKRPVVTSVKELDWSKMMGDLGG